MSDPHMTSDTHDISSRPDAPSRPDAAPTVPARADAPDASPEVKASGEAISMAGQDAGPAVETVGSPVVSPVAASPAASAKEPAPPLVASPDPVVPGSAARSASGRLGALASRHRGTAIAAGLALAALGMGVAADRLVLRGSGAPGPGFETALIEMRQNGEDLGRLRAELHALKASVDSGKAARVDMLAKQGQLAERVDRSSQDVGARIGRLAEQLDRMEKSGRDPARTAAATTSAERADKTAAAASAPAAIVAAVPPAPPPRKVAPDPVATGSLPEQRSADPRKTPLDGYVLRDLDGGMALVEARNGRLFELAPGMTLPGVGRVEAIERRGRNWVVVTPKGYIAMR